MRGELLRDTSMWSYVSPEQRVPAEHPLRPIKAMVDTVLSELSAKFDDLYAKGGRPSIPPERLLCAMVIHVLYSIRSERMLVDPIGSH